MNRESLQHALDLAKSTAAYYGLIALLKAGLAKPDPEPVAWMVSSAFRRTSFSTGPMTPIIGDTRPDHTVTPSLLASLRI